MQRYFDDPDALETLFISRDDLRQRIEAAIDVASALPPDACQALREVADNPLTKRVLQGASRFLVKGGDNVDCPARQAGLWGLPHLEPGVREFYTHFDRGAGPTFRVLEVID